MQNNKNALDVSAYYACCGQMNISAAYLFYNFNIVSKMQASWLKF